MTLDDIRKRIVGGIHDATGTYNKIAAAVPLVPTTKTVASSVSKVQKSVDNASKQVTKSITSGVADVRKRIVSEAKALPTYKSNIAKAIDNPRTAQSNFDLVRQNAPKNVIGKFLANNVANAGESFFSGAHDISEASKIYAKNKNNPVAYIKGAMGIAKVVAPTTPFFQGAQATQSAGQTFKIKPVERVATGALRGQTGTQINPTMEEVKINTPIGSFDPLVSVGSMLGFTKNPAWSKIFGATTPINSTIMTKNPVLNYFVTRSTKGSLEGGIQGAAEWDTNKSIGDNLNTLGSNIGFGLLSEVVMDKPADYVSKKVPDMTKKALKFLESISMSSSQKNFARQGMIGNARKMHPEDLYLFEQANTVINEPKKFSEEHVQQARNYMYLFAEKYLPNRLQPEGGDPRLIARRLNSRMSKGDLQTFESGFIDPSARIFGDKPQTAAEFEVAEGWQPGQKAEFDAAVLDKNSKKVIDMLPYVPQYYKDEFGPTIEAVVRQGGFIDLNAPIGKPMFDGKYSRGDINKVTNEIDRLLGIDPKMAFKEKQKIWNQNYQATEQAANAGMSGAKEDLDRLTRLFNELYNVRKAKELPDNPINSVLPKQASTNNSTNRMYEMMSYGRIMQRAGYKAPQIKGTSLQQFKENILPKLPGQLRAEFLNSAAEVPKMLEMDPKQAMGAAKALLDKGAIRQDEFDQFVRMYSNKASMNPGAKTPMKQVMRDKYAMDNQEAFDSLVEQKNNEELISRMNRQNRPQNQPVRQDARTRFPALDQMDAELDKLFGDTSNGVQAFDKTAPLKEQVQRARLELEYNRNPSIPVYDTPTKTKIANSAQQNAIDDKGEFMKYFSEWVGQRDAAKTRATKTAEPLAKIPKEYAWDVIKYIENPGAGVNEDVKTYAKEVSDLYESLYNQAKEEGIPMNKLVGYITHIWKETPEQVQQKMLGMGQKFKFGKEREIPTYEEGIAMKLTPKYTTPAEIVQEYVRRLEQVKSNIDFFTKLKRKGFVVDASVGAGHPNFEPITGQGFPQSISSTDGHVVTGSYYAPKEVAQIINRVFNPQEANGVLQKTAWASGKMQDVLMSGGLPKTPVNAWSLAQLQKELTAGRITRPVASFIRSFSGEASSKFFSDNAGQIIKLQERNIPISSTYDASNMVDKSFVNKTFGDGWGDVWHKVTSEPTFKRFMPQLQISFFNDIEKKLLKSGKSPKQAADIAAEAVRNFYAVRGTDTAALANPSTEALKTTFLFAPSYRETMIKFWLNNIKSIVPTHIVRENGGLKIKMNNPLSAQNINNTRFMIGSALTLAAYNQLNEYFNDGKNMLQNPRGREDQLLIPVSKITGNENDKTVLAIPWLSSIAYMPRTALKIAKTTAEGDLGQIPRQAKGFLSTMLRPVADVVTNEDYFQNEIYNETDKPTEKWQKTGDYLFKQYGLQHPYMKTGYEAIQGKISSPFELAAKATELPIRFTNKDKLSSQYYYQNRDDVLKDLNEEERKAFLTLPKKSGQESESESSAEARIKYNTYVRYPAVLEAQKQIAIKQANGDMSKVDPLYALDSEQLKYFSAYTAASPGSYERRNILAEAPWIKEFQGIRSAFFDKLNRDEIAQDLKSGKITESEAAQKIQALDENLAKYSGSSSGSKKIKVRKVAAIKKGKNTTKSKTIRLKRIARSISPGTSGKSSKIPTIKLKKKKTNTIANNMAKKFRVVIRKSVS